jgi:Rv2258c-like winged HTH domain
MNQVDVSPTMPIDAAKAEAFTGQMVTVLNHAFLALLTSIGHQTHLFETMASLPPAASPQIAEAARLQERYVREWLAGMVTGGIVEYSADTGTYGLPREHAACLTAAAGADNLAMFAQYIALCGLVEQPLIQAFRDGGGVPYSAYTRFQQAAGGREHHDVRPQAGQHGPAAGARRDRGAPGRGGCPRSWVRTRARNQSHGARISTQPVHRVGLCGRRHHGSTQ